MKNKPTIQQLNEIERLTIIANTKLVGNNSSPLIGNITRYGEELLEDIEVLLSIPSHQTFVEKSIRDFQAKIADQIIANS